MNKKQFDEWDNITSNFDFNQDFVYKQMKRVKIMKFSLRFVQSFALVMICLFVLSNTSTTFVNAVKDIPLLNAITDFMKLNPSVRSALENDYIQELNIEKEKDGFKVIVDSILVDERKLHVIYKVYYDDERLDELDYKIKDHDFVETMTFKNTDITSLEESDLYTINVMGGDSIKDFLHLEYCYEDIKIDFDLPIDKTKIAKAKVIELNQEMMVSNQKLLIEKIEVYPLSAHVFVKEDEDNQYELKNYEFVLESNGKELDDIGLKAVVNEMGKVFVVSSPYFLEDAQIVLKSVQLIPKDDDIILDLETKELYDPYQRVELEVLEEYETQLIIKIRVNQYYDEYFQPNIYCSSPVFEKNETHWPTDEPIYVFKLGKNSSEDIPQIIFSFNCGEEIEVNERWKV